VLTSPKSTEDGQTDSFWFHITRTQCIDVIGVTVAQESSCLARSVNNKRPPTEQKNIHHIFIIMSPQGQTGRPRHNVLNLSVRSSVRSSVCYQHCELDILKTNDARRHKWASAQGHETVNFGRQEVKSQGHRRLKIDLEASVLILFSRVAVHMTWNSLPANTLQCTVFLTEN